MPTSLNLGVGLGYYGSKSLSLSDTIRSLNPSFYWPLNESPAGNSYLTFNGTSTVINCGSAASLDNLAQAGDVTVDFWVKATNDATNPVVFSKGGYTTLAGYMLFVNSSGNGVNGRVVNDAGDLAAASITGDMTDTFHHIVFFWDNSTRQVRVARDGVWGSLSAALPAGNITDAAQTWYMGRRADALVWLFKGDMGWVRLSNNDRYAGAAGTSFTPPPRTTIPTVDANTRALWAMNEGYGTIAGDLTTNNNDGTITAGSWAAYPAAVNLGSLGTSYNGTYVGTTLNNAVAPFTAPYFDGVNDWVVKATIPISISPDELTILAFIKMNTTTPTNWPANVVHIGGFSGFMIAGSPISGYSYRRADGGGNHTSLCQPAGFSSLGWHMVVGVTSVAGDYVRCYIDTTSGNLITGLTPIVGGTLTTFTGGAHNVGYLISGPLYMANLALWNRALSPTEITMIYDKAGI